MLGQQLYGNAGGSVLIAILKQQPFKCLPDFQTGGLMDARGYKDGAGEIKVRAKIKIKDDSTVAIREVPPTTTTAAMRWCHRNAMVGRRDRVGNLVDYTTGAAMRAGRLGVRASNG